MRSKHVGDDETYCTDVHLLVVLREFQESFPHSLVLRATHKVYLEVIDGLSTGHKEKPRLCAGSSILYSSAITQVLTVECV